ncbi:helix-turn-helix domain-containing protein [Gracilimonas sp.]|uniref:helix-turn-helix domain-containing protein n=1 Tax=Gracilimonas sp. TaxID=1974203 RepID=UPI003BAB843A
MNTYIATKQELSDIVFEAVKDLFQKELPELLRKAKRKPWMNTEELIDLTGWSRRTIQYLRDERRIPFSQEGRKILYKTDEIEEYLNDNKIDPLQNF